EPARRQPKRRRIAMAADLVVDADGHVFEPETELARWLPAAWAHRAPVPITTDNGQPRLIIEGRMTAKADGLGPSVAGPFAPHVNTKGRPGERDPRARLPDMDQEGIDVAIIFGTPIALAVNGLRDKELAGAICHAVNRWLVEDYLPVDRKRLKGVGLVPCQDPLAAAKELEVLAH